jgi:thiol:disulfide interchange protein/DsbC/DsbD-like thiol-disulfide interchange protein
MSPIRTLAVLATAWLGASLAQGAAVVTTPQVRAELVAHAPQGVVAGAPLQLGLLIRHQPHWHTYWKNPGDSGLPTTVEWKLPAGLTAGDIQWPTPRKLPIGPLMNFGYEGTVLLPVPVTVSPTFKASELQVALKAEWLVCKDVCIPEIGEFSLTLPTQGSSVAHAAAFESAALSMPKVVAEARGSARVQNGNLVVRIEGLPADWQGREVDLLPETAGVLANAVKPRAQWLQAVWQAELTLDPQRSESPERMPVVLTRSGLDAGLALPVQVSTPWPAAASVIPGTAATASPPATVGPADAAASTPATPAMGWLAAAMLAVLGGLLLNLMPCVFPVLSLKVLGFSRAGVGRRSLLAGGLAYTAGVVLSFVVLAGLMLALRAGGEQLGWGFQLQSPLVVALLAALFTLIGLNLAGVFEIRTSLAGNIAGARGRTPVLDHLLTGVLAVAVAAPCTAPFMGASLGVAVTLPTAQALAVFAALGLGMALPYLVATAWPGLTRRLPRPGAWMVTFKTLMAFPMFGTVVWLLWVLGQQVGIDGAAALLAVLVVLALAAWALGSPRLRRAGRMGLGTMSVALLAATLAWAWPSWRMAPTATSAASSASAEGWEPWSAARVAELQAQGRLVFVDFTAAWCVTCQFNKRTALADEGVKADFSSRGVALMRADWTRRDAAITAELTRLGRSGVPVYALYRPGQPQPELLAEILSAADVRAALARDAASRVTLLEQRP